MARSTVKKAAEAITVTFEFERATKNAYRYSEKLADGQERGVVGTLYVLQSEIAKLGEPESLVVEIRAE